MRNFFAVAVLSALLVLSGGIHPVSAGIMDSPVPDMDPSHPERTIYLVPGVIKNNNLETEFNCTNLDSQVVRIGVEIFDELGNGPLNDITSGVADGAQDVPVGGAVTIGTGNTPAIHESKVISFSNLTPPINVRNGSARIISTSKRVICHAFVVDQFSDPDPVPPTPPQAPAILPLRIISRKQRGD